MATTIKLKNSVTTTNTPSSLAQGEVAINITDKKVWVGNAATTPIQIAGAGTTGNAAGSNTQVQYNSSGSFAGDADFTFNGTTVTMANDASISGLRVGKGGGAVSTNTAVGASALVANTTGANNTAVGSGAAFSTTTPNGVSAFGFRAAYLNTTGINEAFGYQALYFNTTGTNNTAIGYAALQTNTTGSTNVAVGQISLFSNTTGGTNVAVGQSALYSNTTASNNTAVGYQAGYSNTVGTNNVNIGYQAGYSGTTGSYNNTFVGYQAGYASTGQNNTAIGVGSTLSSAGVNYELVIGTNSAVGKGGSTGFISPNGGGVYQGNNSSSWSTTSDRRLKKNIVDNNEGLDKITAIKVRNFEYRLPDEVTELEPTCAVDRAGVQLGVIAQELQEVCPDCVKQESTGVLSVDSDNIFWHMVNAIKELKAEVDSLKAQLNK
jgi:hypothetical protein